MLSCHRDLNVAAKLIALQVGQTKVAYETDLSNLDVSLRKLKYQDYRFSDGPIDLVLDEMGSLLRLDRESNDAYGQNHQLLRKLTHARNMNAIRLTISARTETEALLDDDDNPFVPDGNGAPHHASRLKLLKLTTMSDAEGIQLLLNPLRDLGYPVDENHSELLNRLRGCQGVPALIQDFGLDIANEFAKQRRSTVAID